MAKRIREIIQPATYTPIGLAAYFEVDRGTIRRWEIKGLLPAPSIRSGRTVRWSAATIDAFIAGREVAA